MSYPPNHQSGPSMPVHHPNHHPGNENGQVYVQYSPIAVSHPVYQTTHPGYHHHPGQQVAYAYNNEQMSSPYWPPYPTNATTYSQSDTRTMPANQIPQQHDHQHTSASSHSFSPREAVPRIAVPIPNPMAADHNAIPSPPWSRSEQIVSSLTPAQDQVLQAYLPGDRNIRRREALDEILRAPWKIANQREPQDDLLLQFTTRDGRFYKCDFWRGNEKCVKEFDRKDRALDHIRTHIELQPFVCRELGCNQRFCSKPDLLQHEKNKVKVQCEQCGAPILPKNMARHHATLACKTGRWAASNSGAHS